MFAILDINKMKIFDSVYFLNLNQNQPVFDLLNFLDLECSKY